MASARPPLAVLRPTPADLLSLGLGGGDEAVDLEAEIDLAAFLSACPELELYGCLGRGGMGIVYRARQVRLDRDVAVKLMTKRLGTDPEFAARFEREAKALARLDHPGIVRVHDFGVAAGVSYLVMELVDGPNLRERIDLGIDEAEAIDVMSQLCEALAYAHAHGVVHRDIKPENVLTDRRGRVKVADFGLVKLQHDGPRELARTRRVMGTLHYMAPEQMRDPEGVDARSDIFSIGVVSYEMLTGQLPVGRFPAPSELGHGTPPLDEIVLRALESDRDRRYDTADDLCDALSSMQASAAHEATPSPRWPRAAVVSVAAIASVAVVAAVGLAIWATTPNTPAVAQPPASQSALPIESPVADLIAASETPDLNRWPARELAALDPEVIGVVGLDWGELRQAPLVSRLRKTIFAGSTEEALEPCMLQFAEHGYKAVVAFSESTVQEVVIHGDWTPERLEPCVDALGSAVTVLTPTQTNVGPHFFRVITDIGERGERPIGVAYDANTMVLSLRPEVTVEELRDKLAAKPTSTQFRDEVIAAMDLRAPIWGYGRPSPGILPMGMESLRASITLWDALGINGAATFATEKEAIQAAKLADSYATIIATVPDIPAFSEVSVTRDEMTVRLQATATLDDAAIEALDLAGNEEPPWVQLRERKGLEVHVSP